MKLLFHSHYSHHRNCCLILFFFGLFLLFLCHGWCIFLDLFFFAAIFFVLPTYERTYPVVIYIVWPFFSLDDHYLLGCFECYYTYFSPTAPFLLPVGWKWHHQGTFPVPSIFSSSLCFYGYFHTFPGPLSNVVFIFFRVSRLLLLSHGTYKNPGQIELATLPIVRCGSSPALYLVSVFDPS